MLAVLHHPTSMPACTVGLGASHPPVGSQCWNTGKQQSLIPPCTPALLGCLHSPHPISAPVEDMHSTTAALREHPQQPPVSRSHFSQPLCLWDVGQQWDTRTSHRVRLCSTTSAGTPATRGMQWDPSHSRYPHLVGPRKAGRSPCRDPTSPTLHGIPAASSRVSASPSSALQNHPKSTAVLLQPIGTKLCPTQQHVPKWDDRMGFGGGDTRRPGGSCQCSHVLPA